MTPIWSIVPPHAVPPSDPGAGTASFDVLLGIFVLFWVGFPELARGEMSYAEFFAFSRTVEAYKDGVNKNSVLILTTDSDYYRELKEAARMSVAPGAASFTAFMIGSRSPIGVASDAARRKSAACRDCLSRT